MYSSWCLTRHKLTILSIWRNALNKSDIYAVYLKFELIFSGSKKMPPNTHCTWSLMSFLQQKANLWLKKTKSKKWEARTVVSTLSSDFACLHAVAFNAIMGQWVKSPLRLAAECQFGLVTIVKCPYGRQRDTNPCPPFTSDTFHCKRQIQKRTSETGEKKIKNKTKAWFRLTGKCQCVRNFPARKAN